MRSPSVARRLPAEPVPGLADPGRWLSWQLWHGPARTDPLAVAHLALRHRSVAALDALALAATGGRQDGARARDRVLRGDEPSWLPRTTSKQAALALAWAGSGDPDSMRAAAILYPEVLGRPGAANLPPVHEQAAGQVLFLTGRHEELRSLLPRLHRLPTVVRHYLEVDLSHPGPAPVDGPLDPGSARHQAWEAGLSGLFVDKGVAPLLVRRRDGVDDTGSLFDLLHTPPLPTVGAGHLVTVVMPVHRPDAGLLTSVRSITAQTWPDLEIILVDDASGPEFADLFDRAVDLDPRVRLLRLERNGGTYLARNAALAEAAGEFVTFQDADDWSHPERVARQAQLLLDRPAVPACLSRSVRARPDLTHQWFGYRPVRDNAPSLMFRREVLSRTGVFARVRKGGDSEFTERVAALVGRVAVEPRPLAVYRLRTGSLSRADFSYQWAAPERVAFRGSYRAWHRSLVRDDGSLLRDVATAPSVDPAPFPLTTSFLARPADDPDRQLDRVYLGDFSAPPAPRGDAGLTSELSGQGRVGLWHLEAPRAVVSERPEMHSDWFELLVSSRTARPVARTEPVLTGLVVVLDPAALLLAGDQPCAVRAERVEVRLDPAHVAPDGTGLPVDLLGVSDVCQRWFGTRPVWTLSAELPSAAREQVTAALPGLRIEELVT